MDEVFLRPLRALRVAALCSLAPLACHPVARTDDTAARPAARDAASVGVMRDAGAVDAGAGDATAGDVAVVRVRAAHRSDVNGDGVDDVLLAAPWRGARPGGRTRGVLYGYAGATGGVRARAPSWSLAAPRRAAMFGVDVRPVGDVHGDGYDDVVVSSVDDRPGGRATLYLCAGGADGLSAQRATPLRGVTLRADDVTEVAAGDFDGDGRADVLAGSRGRGWWLAMGGATGLATPVALGVTGVMWVLVRDLDGDGRDDVIATTRGAVHLRWGSSGDALGAAGGVEVSLGSEVGRELVDDGARVWLVARGARRCAWSQVNASRGGVRVAAMATGRDCATRAVPGREGDGLLLRDGDLDHVRVCAGCVGGSGATWRVAARAVGRCESVLGEGDYDGDGARDVLVGRAGVFAQPDRALMLRGVDDGLSRAVMFATPVGESAP